MRVRLHRNERLLGRMKEHILGNGATAASADTTERERERGGGEVSIGGSR